MKSFRKGVEEEEERRGCMRAGKKVLSPQSLFPSPPPVLKIFFVPFHKEGRKRWTNFCSAAFLIRPFSFQQLLAKWMTYLRRKNRLYRFFAWREFKHYLSTAPFRSVHFRGEGGGRGKTVHFVFPLSFGACLAILGFFSFPLSSPLFFHVYKLQWEKARSAATLPPPFILH